jgi:hypothetical protein
MNQTLKTTNRILAIVIAAILVASIPVGALRVHDRYGRMLEFQAKVDTAAPDSDVANRAARDRDLVRRTLVLDAAGIAAAVLGSVFAIILIRRRAIEGWPLMALAVPLAFMVLDTAPAAASLEPATLARCAMPVLAVALYLVMAARMAPRLFYGLSCGCLAAAALFFNMWEPPPPKPVPIAKPLIRMVPQILEAIRATKGLEEFRDWTCEHVPLEKKDEKALGADDYLNVYLTSPDRKQRFTVFVTYYADAMSNIPHVPWVCMTQANYELAAPVRQDDMIISALGNKEFRANVMLFRPGPGMQPAQAMMFQYFNVGGTYECDREVARILAASGSQSQTGSFISQTQVAVWQPASMPGDPTDKRSWAYAKGVEFLNVVVPLLDREYYPNLHSVPSPETVGATGTGGTHSIGAKAGPDASTMRTAGPRGAQGGL